MIKIKVKGRDKQMREKVLFLLRRKRPGKMWKNVSRAPAVILLIAVVLFYVGSGTGEAVPPTIPLTPELTTVTVVSGSEVKLIWQDTSDNENGFAVERKTGSGQFLEITTLGADVTSFTDTTGLSETTYTYRIKAFNNAGASYSNEITITIMAAPSALTATGVAGTRVDLSWNDQTIYEDWYEIERKLPGGNYTVIGSVAAGVTSASDLSVSPGTTYYYRVRALNTWGYSSYSNEATVNTLIGNPPAAPSNLNSTAAGKDSITLSWTDNAGNETGFRIERKLTGGTFAEVATVSANVTTYINTGLASNTSYHYRIYAYNAAGNSAYSNEISAVTLLEVPAAPTNLKAGTLTKNSVSLSWTDNASNEIGYKLERKTGTGTYSQIATFNANTTSYTNTNLTPNTTYTYRVRAYNATDNSNYSNEISVKTPAGDLPAAPTKLELSAVATDRIAITWTDNSSNEAGFKIERKTGTGSFTQIATVGANVTSLVNTGLKVNTQYTYRIRAYNTYGDSSYSNEISATTGNPPAAPSALKVIELTRRDCRRIAH